MRKRSKYRPKPQLPDPLNWVLAGMRPVLTAKTIMENVRIKNHLALRSVVEGDSHTLGHGHPHRGVQRDRGAVQG